jgi:hypothetical protein
MLSTLDTVIAFAVIMTVLSLLITILVQMASAAFSLRGKNLANALSLTFQTIDPKIGEHAHSLAAQILRDPIFSDSIWRNKNRQTIDPKALLLIGAERKLKEAQEEVAKAPGDAIKSQAVANATAALAAARVGVKIPTVTPNRMKQWAFWSWPWGGGTQLGSAIRPGEVYRVLHELDDMGETEAAFHDIPPALVRHAASVIAALRKQDHPAIESQLKLHVIAKVSEFLPLEQRQAVVDSLANFGATVERATTQAYDRFQRWFGSAQDRAEQWFQMHIRIATIVFAILTAFLLQLDTIDIFRTLRDRPGLVEALVKSAPGFVEQGGKILDPSDTVAHRAYLLWLVKHPLFELKALPPNGTAESYRDALQALFKEKAVKPGETNDLLAEYDAIRNKGVEEFLRSHQEAAITLKDQLAKTGFDLVPGSFLGRWDGDRASELRARIWQFWPHLLGVLLSAGLLTLGPPFWFNLLKNLMSLRPAVANLIEKRPTSAPALPAAPEKPPSPS